MPIEKFMCSKPLRHGIDLIPYYFGIALVLSTFMIIPVYAERHFNAAFLTDNLSNATVSDLSRFETKNYQLPGTYRVEIYVNYDYMATGDVIFIDKKIDDDKSVLFPCLSVDTLSKYGINTAQYPKLATVEDDLCVPFTTIIDGANYQFNFQQQKLMLSFPQASLDNRIKGYIPPNRWDSGIKAFFVNYNLTGSNNSEHSSSFYTGINAGINLGLWQFRQSGSWDYTHNSNTSTSQWQNQMIYLQRPIIPIKSQLVMGDGNSSNDIFDSLSFRGVRLYTADNMYPDSQQGYAPTVRGIAKTNAKVVIRQNGYIIYQAYIPPGPFIIDDLNPTTSSGDLYVAIEENDGTTQSYVVPYSTLPNLQREGRVKYDLVVGKYRSGNNNQNEPGFAQAALTAGLASGISIYSGTQLASKYQSYLLGVGKNLGEFGAFSFDFTHANSELSNGDKHKGQSVRFLYAKSLNRYGTTFQLLGYRYSTEGFYTLSDTAYSNLEGYQYALGTDNNNNSIPVITDYHNLRFSKKGRLQINLSQSLADYGYIYLSGNQQTYWGEKEKDEWYQAGYSNTWYGLNGSISFSTNKMSGIKKRNNLLSINISLPLSVLTKQTRLEGSPLDDAYATFSSMNNSSGSETYQVGVNGALLEGKNLNYSVTQGHTSRNGYLGSAGLSYQGSYGTVGLGYNYDSDNKQLTYSVAGGVLMHENGVTFGQSLGDTSVLIKAPGAPYVSVDNYTGVKTDWRGYAILPYASSYRNNRISLDTNTFSDNLEIRNNVDNVIPIQGAIVRATFATSIGIRAIITLTRDDKMLPFGSSVSEGVSKSTGIVDDNSKAYLTGLPLTGELLVKWGQEQNDQCLAKYDFTDKVGTTALLQATLRCQ